MPMLATRFGHRPQHELSIRVIRNLCVEERQAGQGPAKSQLIRIWSRQVDAPPGATAVLLTTNGGWSVETGAAQRSSQFLRPNPGLTPCQMRLPSVPR
ncbi:hypothetical protein MN608_02016 [Microdochium nivale]|nr:hypothetical protein MN608_02016 [Microdochium nivale]